MASLTFSAQIGNFFSTLKDGEKPVNFPSPLKYADDTSTAQSPSKKTNSDVFILLNTQQCEFNLGVQDGTPSNTEHAIKKEPECIVIDSSDEEDIKQEIELGNEAIPDSECFLPVQTMFLPEKHFLSELINETEFPEEFGESVISSNMCDGCGKPRTLEFVNGSQENASLCECENRTAYGTDDCDTVNSSEDPFTLGQGSGRSFRNYSQGSSTNNIYTKKSKKVGLSPFTCPNCSKEFNYESVFKIHCDFHCKATQKGRLICSMCSNNYAGPNSLMQHMLKVHKTKISMKNACNANRISLSELSKPFLCYNCNKGFDTQEIFDTHFQSCNAQNIHKATPTSSSNKASSVRVKAGNQVRNTGFETQQELCNNDTEEVKFENVNDPLLKTSEMSDTYKYICEKCGAAFALRSQLLKHHKLHSAVEISTNKCGSDISEKKYSGSQDEAKKYKANQKYKSPRENNKFVHGSLINEKRYKSKNNLRATGLLKFFKKSGYGNSCFCPICGKYVYSPSFLNVHMRKHTNEKPFSCRKCSKGFFTKVALKYHILTKCPKRINLENDREENERPRTQERKSNIFLKHSETVNKSNLLHHNNEYIETLNDSDDTSSENACSTTFGSKVHKSSFPVAGKLKQSNWFPRSNISQEVKCRFECQYCKNSYSYEYNLNRHIRTSCTGKINSQNSSDLQFDTSNVESTEDSSIESNHNYGRKNRNFICTKCQKRFNGLMYLKRHKRHYCKGRKAKSAENVHFVKQKTDFKAIDLNKIHGKMPFLCGVCNKSFQYPSMLRNHIASSHNNETEIICNSCKTEFNSFPVFKDHLVGGTKTGYVCSKVKQSIVGNYKCKKCGKTFNNRASFNGHVRICSTKEKNIQIPETKKGLTIVKLNTASTSNTKTDHSGKNKGNSYFMCHVCNIDFEFPSMLQRHIGVHKSGFNPTCKDCDVTFEDFDSYKNHFLTGTGKKSGKRYACPNTKESIKDSVKPKNKSTSELKSENVFCCNVCNCKFPTIPVLVQHLQKHMMIDDNS